MTQLKPRTVESNLTRKGFRQTEGDHSRFVFYFEGRKTEIRTMVSHNSRDIGDELIHRMAKQVRLSKNEFVELASCTMGEEAYTARLRAVGVRLEAAAAAGATG